MSVIVSAHISDIHFGASDSDELMQELKFYFLKKCRKMPKLNNIFIQGDLYNHELSLNSRAAYNSFRFAEEVENISYEKNANLVVIQGTKSHDHVQLNNLKFKNRSNTKIIKSVRSENLMKDFKVLYLPEEYMNNPDEYYSYYFDVPDNYYDMIVGHGMVEEASFHNFNSETNIKTAPVFNSKELCRICRGPITFGHVHNALIIRNQIYYTGSFSRWCQGEENPKGYYFTLYNTETGAYRVIPVINKMARKYIKRNITKSVINNSLEKTISDIETFMLSKNVYKLHLVINQINNQEMIMKSNIIQKYFMNNKHVTITINKILLDNDNSVEEELLEHFEYLFDEELDEEDKINIYINNEFEYEITKDRVHTILTEDIIKIVNNEIYQLGNGV